MADEKKQGEVVDPQDALQHGYWGYNPTEKDRKEYTVEVQAPLAEEAAKGGARAEGVGTVDKAAADRQQVTKRTSSK
jgi:hypothetical protein